MAEEVRDIVWFGRRLREQGVCGMYLKWENHHADFNEVRPDLMDFYLYHRSRLFHAEALQAALNDSEATGNHPWSLR